jgi:hypothetical protein
MNADIHYTRSGDTPIAYKVGGKGPPDMVFVPGYISHLEMSWELPQASRVWHRLTSFGRIMTFDKRGTGLSDPITDDRLPGLEQRMDDMRAVMDAVGSWRGVLIGGSEGAILPCRRCTGGESSRKPETKIEAAETGPNPASWSLTTDFLLSDSSVSSSPALPAGV